MVPVHVLDHKGLILYANLRELEILGYAAHDYVGKYFYEFVCTGMWMFIPFLYVVSCIEILQNKPHSNLSMIILEHAKCYMVYNTVGEESCSQITSLLIKDDMEGKQIPVTMRMKSG